ncbi:conjugative transposon protein TraM [Muribaculaceae bacterium Isolate-039 (Harlan)]|nr:conjugative transposon protein TraM [Muribaculaceae bacterium Isolate-039 (Harlan)]
MTIQEWKAKINSYFQPKTTAEPQKMMKYLVVFPAAILSGVVILWLLYSSLNKEDTKTGNAFNTEIPAGESEKIGTKVQEYEAADAAKKKQARIDVVGSLDTIATSSPLDTVAESSAIESSVSQYQQVQASIQDFYVPDYSQTEQVAELQARIEELEAQNAMVTQQAQQPDEMEMLERSYQLAAQYMGNGNGGNYPPPRQSEEKGKRNVQPVTQVNRSVVSSLSASSDRGFNTSVGRKTSVAKNTIAAVVANDQSVINGQSVKLRLTEPMWVGNALIPRNTPLVGVARLQGERLEVAITSIEANGSVYEVDLTVYDSDGQEGINIPNSMESDALHEIGANMGSTMGSSINLTTNTGAQIASDVGRGLINGVSQYLNKKLRTVKVHLKAGYRVMIHQPEDV